MIRSKYIDYSIIQSKSVASVSITSKENYLSILHSKSTLLKSIKRIVNKSNERLSKIDLLFLPFSFALIFDNRSFWRMYWDYLLEKLPLFRLFSPLSPFELFTVKLTTFVLSVSLTFSLNALLLSDQLIVVKLLGQHNQHYFFLVNSFVVIIVTQLIIALMGILLTDEKTLKHLIAKISHKRNLSIGKSFMFKVSVKISLYFIIGIGLNALGMYYTSLFCIIYQNNKMSLLRGGCYSLAFWLVFCSLMGLFVSALRFVSIVCQRSKLYFISTYLHYQLMSMTYKCSIGSVIII